MPLRLYTAPLPVRSTIAHLSRDQFETINPYDTLTSDILGFSGAAADSIASNVR